MKNVLCLILFSILSVTVCVAQSTDPETNRVFGKSICGIQMSIALDTNILVTGSLIGISAEIKNSSTNEIHMVETAPALEFEVLLTDGSGNKYELTDTHPPALVTLNTRIGVNPGESRDWTIPITISDAIKPGDYSLKATRKFKVNGNAFKVESNLLNVQIQ